jgi:hypothetical protein
MLLAALGLGLPALALPSVAHATLAAEEGLGAASAFMVDDASYTSLPQVVDTYKGATYFEFGIASPLSPSAAPDGQPGNAASAWGGADIPLGAGALGVWVGRPDGDFAGLYARSQMNAVGVAPGFAPSMDRLAGLSNITVDSTVDAYYGAEPAQARVDLIYAFDFSDRLRLAVGLNRASTAQEINFGSAGFASYNDDNLGLNLGADYKGLPYVKLLQVGLQLNEESILAATNIGGTENKFVSSAEGFSLRVGAEIPASEGSFGRAELGLKGGGLSVRAEPGEMADNGGATDYHLGYALGETQDRGMGLCGLMIHGSVGGDDDTWNGNSVGYNTLNLVLSTAGEMKLREWLTARAGLSGSLYSQGTVNAGSGVNATPGYSASNSGLADGAGPVAPAGAAQVSLGLTLNLGSITVDGGLNQNLLYSGSARVGDEPGARVSMVWNWD